MISDPAFVAAFAIADFVDDYDVVNFDVKPHGRVLIFSVLSLLVDFSRYPKLMS